MTGELHILDRSGHSTLAWDTETENTEAKKGPLDPKVVAKEFNRLVAEGHLGYGTTEKGVNEQIKKFDPARTPQQYAKVTLTPPMSGG